LQGIGLIGKRQVMNSKVRGLSLIDALGGKTYQLFYKCSLSSKTFSILDHATHPKFLLLKKLMHIP